MSFVPIYDISKEIEGRKKFLVGDIHGCLLELIKALQKVDFDYKEDVLISVGDLVDRGPYSAEVLHLCMFTIKHFYMVQGNHDNRLLRHLKGNKVKITHGLEETIKSLDKFPIEKAVYRDWLEKQPYIIKFNESDSFSSYAVHAGINPTFSMDKQKKEDCLYSRYFGGKDYFDNENGQYWYKSLAEVNKNSIIYFGHEVHLDKAFVVPNVVALDGGCVFGGELRLWCHAEQTYTSVKAYKTYSGTKDFTPEVHLDHSRAHFNENVKNAL